MLGLVGSGKSTVGNRILGKEKYKTSNGALSETQFFSVSESDKFRVIDSPGVADLLISK